MYTCPLQQQFNIITTFRLNNMYTIPLKYFNLSGTFKFKVYSMIHITECVNV